ncbi:hypothetical protein CDD81_1037 [Ophiocordyceps australis]|uniref:Uncharacterized protein n=1 Tax=Ophiocordyceps australis TaxID=1399860 RepID=A0A2C5XZT5_9HYPO|nr:hypothetical protein CDD81_1037 [Ophiocordyceps australis]
MTMANPHRAISNSFSKIGLCLLLVCANCLTQAASQHDVVDYDPWVRNTSQVKAAIRSITAMSKGGAVPYKEAPLTAAQGVNLSFVSSDWHPRLFWRQIILPATLNVSIEIFSHLDFELMSEGNVEVTTSTAVINTERQGWKLSQSREQGHAVGMELTGEVSTGFFKMATKNTYNVHGSKRWTDEQRGATVTQQQFRASVRFDGKCGKNQICRVLTWTYTKSFRGVCLMFPLIDVSSCDRTAYSNAPANYSLAVFNPKTSPILTTVAEQFFELDTYDGNRTGAEIQGCVMHRHEAVKRSLQQGQCSFSYTLRKPDGTPLRTQAMLAESYNDHERRKRGAQDIGDPEITIIHDDLENLVRQDGVPFDGMSLGIAATGPSTK